MANADISLLFGVLGEGSLSGESGSLIQGQLTQIMTELNKKPLKVKVSLDTDTGGQRSWTSQLQSKLNAISKSNKLTIQVSKISVGQGVITDFKKQLNTAINTLNLDKGMSMTLNAEGIGEITAKAKEAAAASKQVKSSVDGATQAIREEGRVAKEVGEQVKATNEQIEESTERLSATQMGIVNPEQQAALQKANNLLAQVTANLEKWTAAEHGQSRESYTHLKEYAVNIETLINDLNTGTISQEEFNKKFRQASVDVSTANTAIKTAGENTKSFIDRLGGLAWKFSSWLSVSQVIMKVVRTIRQMVDVSIELEGSLTQLRIVTHATGDELKAYGNTVATTAKRIGASITDLVDSTTTFARLGYSLADASKFAEFTTMLKNVGNIKVGDAQDAVTAIVKAYGVQVDELESIMDKLVAVGNGTPISVAQIAEGMNNASSTLQAAGNDFQQSVALLTAANTTVQNAAKASTGLRTIAARLRNTKTELDELGETMTEANYEELVSALTKHNVALTTANGEYRSTYEIMQDIAAQWSKMTTMEQSAIATAVSGTRQQAIFFSIIEQFREAINAMGLMANSAGTLQKSYDTYLESTTAHINQFKAAFQELSYNVMESGFLQFFIDLGTNLVSLVISIDNVIDKLGGLKTVLLTLGSVIMITKAEWVAYVSELAIEAVIKTVTAGFQGIITGIQGILNILPAAIIAWKGYAAGTVAANVAMEASIPVIGLVLAAITALVVGYNLLHKSTDELRQEYQSLESEVETLNGKLTESRKRIAELQRQSRDGGLSLVEEEELNRLQQQNDLIAAQIELQKALISAKKQEVIASARNDAKDYLKDGTYQMYTSGGEAYTVSTTKRDKLLEAAQKYRDVSEAYAENIRAAGEAAEAGNIKEAQRLNGWANNYSESAAQAIKTVTDELENVINLRNDLANSVEESDIEKVAALDKLIDSVTILTNTEATVDRIFKRFFPTEEELQNAEKVKAFASYMEEIGHKVDVTDVSLAKMFATISDGTGDIDEATRAVMSFKDRMDGLDGISETFGTLTGVMNDIAEGGKVTYSTLSGIAEKFASVDGIETYIERLGAVKKDSAEANKILNELMQAYIDTGNNAEVLAGANQDVVASLLKEIGVSNSAKSAEEMLAYAKARVAAQTAVTSGEVLTFIDNLDNEAIEAGVARESLAELVTEMITAENTVMTFDEQIAALQKLYVMAGLARGELGALAGKYNEEVYWMKKYGFSEEEILAHLTQKTMDELNAKFNTKFDANGKGNSGKNSFGGNYTSTKNTSSSKSTDQYFADIDRFRKYVKDLNDAQEEASRLSGQIGRTGALERQAQLHDELANKYNAECDALHALNEVRREAIKEGVDVLNGAGLGAEYDPKTNDLYIRNLERINKLTYQDIPYGLRKFEYDSNGNLNYKKQLEGLAETITGWNSDAKSDSENWFTAFDNAFENRISAYEKRVKLLENQVTLTENWLDNAVEGYDFAGITKYSKNIVSYYRKMQDEIAAEAAYYRSLGYSDTSDEVSALSDLWWDYQDKVKNSIAATWNEVMDNMHGVVDTMQSVYDTLHKAADEYAATGGTIMLDTYQEILKMGPGYLQLLKDENGQFVIQEENIRALIKAQTEELALAQAKSFLEQLDAVKDDAAALEKLTDATVVATGATWELYYAQLAQMGLSDETYNNAAHILDVYRSLSTSVVDGYNTLDKSSDLLKYVMDMIKQNIQNQIDALNDQKTAYKEIVDLRKKALDDQAKEVDYQKDVAKKTQEIAKLQARINAISLDDSRDAQAQKAKLEEEMYGLQEELADKQADYARDAQKDALDDMYDAYADEKDKEIEELQKSISSYQKLYDKAIEYIRNNYDGLLDDLKAWNYEYGNDLEQSLKTAWDNAKDAAQEYFNLLDRNGVTGNHVSDTIELANGTKTPSDSPGNNLAVSDVDGGAARRTANSVATAIAASQKATDRETKSMSVADIVQLMKNNAAAWQNGTEAEQKTLEYENERLAECLNYGKGLHVWKKDGVWYEGSEKLFEKYHTGGAAGGGTFKQNEILALLEKGEMILNTQKEQGLYRLIDFATSFSDKFDELIASAGFDRVFGGTKADTPKPTALAPISESGIPSVQFGDVYIYGANDETVEKHRQVNREFMNKALKEFNLKR